MTTYQTTTIPAYIDALLVAIQAGLDDAGITGVQLTEGEPPGGSWAERIAITHSEPGGDERQWTTLGNTLGNKRRERYFLGILIDSQQATASAARNQAYAYLQAVDRAVTGVYNSTSGRVQPGLGVTTGQIIDALLVQPAFVVEGADQGYACRITTGVIVQADLRAVS